MPTQVTATAASAAAAGVRPVTQLTVTGMTCNNCARHVSEALQAVPGVQTVTVNLEGNQATVRWANPGALNIAAALHAVEEEGYGARLLAEEPASDGTNILAGWQLNLWVGLPVTALLMAGEWLLGLMDQAWFQWTSFVLAALVQGLAGARFYRGAWNQLKVGHSNMDALVSLGSTTAFAYSTWALLSGRGGHLYFMEAASIITLISLGHWMESRVSVRASSALRHLLNLAPEQARRLLPDGSEQLVPVAELQPADRVVLRPGDRVPTDARVLEGDSALDESMLTGESAPVDKAPGSALYAGTVNLNGRLVAQVTATGEETALAHIIQAVQHAQSSRAQIQRLGDKVSSVFVPIVTLIALGAALLWGLAPQQAAQLHGWLAQFLWMAHPPTGALAGALITAAAVLIIACPCAMGLATPAAIMAGSNTAAQRGILIRDGVALEKAGLVTAVLFDKTGTLTVGKPALVNQWKAAAPATPPAREMAAPVLAAALGRRSNHPLSRALAGLAADEMNLQEWQEIRGGGVQARLQPEPGLAASAGMVVRLGSPRWLRECGVVTAEAESFIQQEASQGATLVGVALETSLLGLFAVKDTLKPGAPQVIAQLHHQGLKTFLVTGDNPLTAASIAAQAGIGAGSVFAEVRPEQKAALVRKLQDQGERVAFVGDGINDAPALEQADLGIAVSRASDIAREAADIILLKSEIEAVPESLGLARATLRTIRQNLFWAFFYNALGIPLAALGFMSPILCAASMGLSDLVVIGNALRLRRWKLR